MANDRQEKYAKIQQMAALVKERSAKRAKRQFKTLDTNSDSKITREEWMARYGTEEGFGAYDANGDEVIDADEWAKRAAVTDFKMMHFKEGEAESPSQASQGQSVRQPYIS